MKKRDYYLCENKDADQLCSNCTADQRLCFRYTGSKFKLLAIFCNCTDRIVSDLYGDPIDRFSRVMAQKQSIETTARVV